MTATEITLDIDAPRDPAYTRAVAEAAAEAIRVLNHATFGAGNGALRHPSDIDAVLRSLAALAFRLPQLRSQLAAWLEAEQAAGRIQVTGGEYEGKPALAVAEARSWLAAAAVHAAELAEALDAAAGIACHMGAGEVPGGA